tara:strand:- start:1681 stop:2169 length:489 start_codon:yes stop_codon:yes gene_type:complete
LTDSCKALPHFIKKLVATLGFSGYAPIAPGTAGSAVTAIIYYFFCSSLGVAAWLAVLALTFFVAVYTAQAMVGEWGKDPGAVVVDEGVGFLVTVAFLPHGLWTAVVGFFVFRALDIIKPQPARRLEDLPGGWGIVMDDVIAGVYGNVLMRIGMMVFPSLSSS